MKTSTIVLLIVASAVVFGGVGYLVGTTQSKSSSSTASVTPSAVASKKASASATSTADATANWKTYTNDTYGFSFKYPSDWTATESTTFPSALISIGIDTPSRKEANKCHGDGCDSPNSMAVRYYESIDKFNSEGGYSSLTDYLNGNTGSDTKKYSSYNQMKIGRESGYKAVAGNNTFGGGTYYYIAKNDGKILEIWMFDGDKEVTPIIDSQILSTFQFTK